MAWNTGPLDNFEYTSTESIVRVLAKWTQNKMKKTTEEAVPPLACPFSEVAHPLALLAMPEAVRLLLGECRSHVNTTAVS
jgi:hypothetical protein